ncbi:MAG: hypothetical protein MPJ50_01495 [Pirellulales bacterium]|nr:hypothetical protein [Pirellulales bacterium]
MFRRISPSWTLSRFKGTSSGSKASLIGCLAFAATAVILLPTEGITSQDRTAQDARTQDAGKTAEQDAGKTTLEKIQDMVIGDWRGVGQPRRGSSRGSWIEKTAWSWKFTDKGASLAFTSEDGKFYTSGTIRPGDAAGKYLFVGVTADGKQETLSGARNEEGMLVFSTDKAEQERPARITLRNVAGGDRLLILFERKFGEDRYARLAEIGYTRQGSGFGQGASTGPECVVTGGLGTIQVEHNGKEYFVCCSGCRDLFNEDPERILAEYAKRKKKAQDKIKQK